MNEYVAMFNPNWPKNDIKIPQGGYETKWEAAEQLIKLLNAHYPGRWQPESLLSPEPRYIATDADGMNGLLAFVDERPVRKEILERRFSDALREVEYHQAKLIEVREYLKTIDAEIRALEDGSAT